MCIVRFEPGTAKDPGFHGAQSDASSTPSASLSAQTLICVGFAVTGQLSHASPTPSASRSCWDAFASDGQLSQALPRPSPSPSCWPVLATYGQLSVPLATPSPSASALTNSSAPMSDRFGAAPF